MKHLSRSAINFNYSRLFELLEHEVYACQKIFPKNYKWNILSNGCEDFNFENLLIKVVKNYESVWIFSRLEKCKYFIHVECHIVSGNGALNRRTKNNYTKSIKHVMDLHPIWTKMKKLRNRIADRLNHKFVDWIEICIPHDLTPLVRRVWHNGPVIFK